LADEVDAVGAVGGGGAVRIEVLEKVEMGLKFGDNLDQGE